MGRNSSYEGLREHAEYQLRKLYERATEFKTRHYSELQYRRLDDGGWIKYLGESEIRRTIYDWYTGNSLGYFMGRAHETMNILAATGFWDIYNEADDLVDGLRHEVNFMLQRTIEVLSGDDNKTNEADENE